MAEPVLEQIAQKVFDRVLQVRKANGYNVDVTVQRPSRGSGIEFDNYRVAILQHDPEESSDYSLPGNPPAIAWKQPFAIYLIIRPSDKDTTPYDKILNTFQADVEKALKDADDWYRWDGLAVNSSMAPSVPFVQESGAHEGRIMTLNVYYRVDETDPYNVRA